MLTYRSQANLLIWNSMWRACPEWTRDASVGGWKCSRHGFVVRDRVYVAVEEELAHIGDLMQHHDQGLRTGGATSV